MKRWCHKRSSDKADSSSFCIVGRYRKYVSLSQKLAKPLAKSQPASAAHQLKHDASNCTIQRIDSMPRNAQTLKRINKILWWYTDTGDQVFLSNIGNNNNRLSMRRGFRGVPRKWNPPSGFHFDPGLSTKEVSPQYLNWGQTRHSWALEWCKKHLGSCILLCICVGMTPGVLQPLVACKDECVQPLLVSSLWNSDHQSPRRPET